MSLLDHATLPAEEIIRITGCRQKKRQLDALHAHGYTRARIAGGELILETAHYIAVCEGRVQPATIPSRVKKIRG